MGWLERIVGWLEQRLGVRAEIIWHLGVSLVIIAAYMVAVRVANRIAARTVDEASSRYQISKASGYVFGVIAILALAKVWVQGITGLATYLGLLSAGVAIALQDPIINLAGWMFILVRRPFEVGDRIQIGTHAGDVVDIRLFQFTLLEIGNWVEADQSTGRIIHVPNGWVFKNSIASYDGGFKYVWNEIPVTLTFESDWRRAKENFTKLVQDHAEHLTADAMKAIGDAAERYHIKFAKLTPVVWTSVVDSGIRLTMRYLVRPRDRRRSGEEMWEAVLDEVAKTPNVDLAYPTTRFYDNRNEGKAAYKPTPAEVDERASRLPPEPISRDGI